jgi:hypothetical protein
VGGAFMRQASGAADKADAKKATADTARKMEDAK